MNGFRIAVAFLLTLVAGCKAVPTNVIVRWESPIPLQVMQEKMNVRVEFSQLGGHSFLTTTILPEVARHRD